MMQTTKYLFADKDHLHVEFDDITQESLPVLVFKEGKESAILRSEEDIAAMRAFLEARTNSQRRYLVYRDDLILLNTDNFDEITVELVTYPNITIIVQDGVEVCRINNPAELHKMRGYAPDKDHINPSHYQGYVDDLQWLETMMRLPTYRNPIAFEGALEILIRGYLDRRGQKDDELQELKKAAWYLNAWIQYVENDKKPFRLKK